jgi:hypothetical protein
MTVAASLWVFAVLLWIILIYTFFASVTVAEPKPSLEVAINGSWLLVSWEVLHDFPAFDRRLYTVFWATGTWWISAVGFWRHMVVRDVHCLDVGVCECHWDAVSADHPTYFCLYRDVSLIHHVQCCRDGQPDQRLNALLGVF